MSRDAFGRLTCDPSRLDLAGKVEAVEAALGAMRASRQREVAWLGECVSRWLAGAEPTIEHALGLRPAPGSRKTAQAVALAKRQARALLALAAAAGSDARALQIARGAVACPRGLEHLVDEARALRCPMSANAISRARASSRHGS